jgi:glutamyl-tRNA reductase
VSAELFCIGLSHKTAPLSVRERMALPEERQVEVLRGLQGVPEAMLISTCNRVEVYAVATEPSARDVLMSVVVGIGGDEALHHTYEHRGDAALAHLFRVAASLDSMVVGEPQILGQVKDAFQLAQRAGVAKAELTRACSAAFESAKRIRTETGVGRAAMSMASAAVDLAAKIFGAVAHKAVLLVGAGEMAELVARHLKTAGVTQMAIANRTVSRAEELARAVGASAVPFEAITERLVWADLVVCSTASPQPIFTRDGVSSLLKARKHRPLFMVDLAVPRDVAPDVNALQGVYAYDVDDIQKVVSENAAARAAEAAKAEVIVAEEVSRFVRARALREGVPVLAQLRKQAEKIMRAELERTLEHLGELNDKQRKSIEAMGAAIVNKLLHQPTAKLRALNPEDDMRLAGAAAELFGLDEPGEAAPPAANPAAAGGSKR